MASKEGPNVSSPINEEHKDITPFPLARYWYHGNFRFYYAYGNTPADDFLESCTVEREPFVLALGCGDIRSCFYTLWKNFDYTISNAPKRFDGVHFTLNDCSAAVLARNIVFLHLCLQLPEETMERKKWLSAMWAIWYCHELYPNHLNVLNDSLRLLLRFSASLKHWVSKENPIQHLVKITSSTCLANIAQVWKMWLDKAVFVSSVKHMHESRNRELEHRGVKENIANYTFSYSWEALYICGQTSDSAVTDVAAREPEVKSYLLSGNCYAEGVLNLPRTKKTQTSVNLTLYEKEDGVYSLHYGSIPYSGYYHTVEFSPQYLKSIGVSQPQTDVMVSPTSFQTKPFLANSVQQFSMWVQSSNRVLRNSNILVSFSFNNQHALTFCQELQQEKKLSKNGSSACEVAKYSVIATSNLMDHLGPPNVVLAAVPLLKDRGLLFTTTLIYKTFTNTIEEFLSLCFGFDCRMFPVIFGIRCINHEGVGFASSTLIKPTPPSLANMLKALQHERMLIWEKISGVQALTFARLPHIAAGNITDSLINLVRSSSYTLLYHDKPNMVLNNICSEAAILVLLRFISLCGIALSDFAYWEPLCTSLVSTVQPFIHGLQTQMLLHDIHVHLTVTEDDCPLCNQVPIESVIGSFCAEVPLSLLKLYTTPHFVVMVHKKLSSDSRYLLSEAIAGRDVHIFDCLDGTVSNNTLRIMFFAPLKLVKQNYKVTVSLTMMGPETNITLTIIPCASFSSLQTSLFAQYEFLKPDYPFSSHQKENSFGVICSHICDGFKSETEVTLSKSALEALSAHKLSTVQLLSNELHISCGSLSLQLKYCYPISCNTVSINDEKMCISCQRQPHVFEGENTCFVANPDHKLSILPLEMSMNILTAHSRCQYTNAEAKVIGSCNQDLVLLPPLVKVKETLRVLFESRKCSYFYLLSPEKNNFLGFIVVNKVLFDYQHRTPAIDLAFCFLNCHSNSEVVLKKWEEIVCPAENVLGIRSIEVDDTELELLQKTLDYFARRTNGSLESADSHCRYHSLGRLKVDHVFTRAVVYLLLSDPDVEFTLTDPCASSLKASSSYRAPRKQSTNRKESTNPYLSKNDGGCLSKCLNCKKTSSVLKKCTRCRAVQYCSKDCQTKHWPEHKKICSDTARVQNDDPESVFKLSSMYHDSLKCACCKKTSCSLKKCIRCGAVQYCNQDCQRKHWPEHKKICHDAEKIRNKPHKSSMCAFCGSTSGKLLACGRCGEVKYCGKDCQTKHWKEHKTMCTCLK